MSTTITLRTLTPKSKIGWGTYANKTVQELLDARNYKYLAWLYYNVQWLTYTEDILQQIKIWDKERIPKPGIDPEMHERRLRGFRHSRLGDKAGAIILGYKRRIAKRRAAHMERDTDFSPAQLQAINHGHAPNRIFK